MRQVALYTLKKEEVLVTSDYINFCSNIERPFHIRGSDEFIMDSPVEVKQVPVERYVNLQGRSEKEYLVAFDPEIRKLLGINEKALKEELYEVKQRNENTLKTNKGLVEYKNQLLKENEDLVNKLYAYSLLTFWQRLVFLFTGVIKGVKE